jgi:hypothetical protein
MIAKTIARTTTCRVRKSREVTSMRVITRPVAMSVPSRPQTPAHPHIVSARSVFLLILAARGVGHRSEAAPFNTAKVERICWELVD